MLAVSSAVVIAIVAVLLIALAVVVVLMRRSGPRDRNEGIAGFRRHMDALSSDARRDVIDRVREARRDSEED